MRIYRESHRDEEILQIFKLRVGAAVITFYTIWFISEVAWKTYLISCQDNIGYEDLSNL